MRNSEKSAGRSFLYTITACVAGTVLFAAGLVRAAGDEPCRIAKGDSPVARACAEGGVIRAKQSMRVLMKQARAGGARFTCDDCHTDGERYEQLSADARQNFAKLLAAVAKDQRNATAR